MADEDATRKAGIYSYLLDGKEKHLNIRQFSPNQKREAYERQKGICKVCGKHFELDEMEGDHITLGMTAERLTPLTVECCALRTTARRAERSPSS